MLAGRLTPTGPPGALPNNPFHRIPTMTQPIRQRTSYATFQEAQADGWRQVNRKTDRDISGENFFGYEYQSPDGQESTTIRLTQERNKIGRLGCFVEMFRDSHA